MPSINYPFPDPQNAAEREANRQAVDDYTNDEVFDSPVWRHLRPVGERPAAAGAVMEVP